MLQSFFFQHSSKESIISRRFSIELYKSFHMTSKYLHASFLFPFCCYCNKYFLSALLRWRSLRRHRYHFRRKCSYYSHDISDSANSFLEAHDQHFIDIFPGNIAFSTTTAIMMVLSWNDVLSQVRFPVALIHVKSPQISSECIRERSQCHFSRFSVKIHKNNTVDHWIVKSSTIGMLEIENLRFYSLS